ADPHRANNPPVCRRRVNDSRRSQSRRAAVRTSFPAMAGPGTRSILYRLIEAGQLARRALLVPLGERGLEAGDDAILLMLRRHPGAAEADLAVALGLDVAVLHDRLRRLFARDLLVLRHSGLALTERGTR